MYLYQTNSHPSKCTKPSVLISTVFSLKTITSDCVIISAHKAVDVSLTGSYHEGEGSYHEGEGSYHEGEGSYHE